MPSHGRFVRIALIASLVMPCLSNLLAGPVTGYQVDVKDSQVYVRVDSATRLGHQHGVSGRLTRGTFNLDTGGEFVFDMKSFVADTAAARRYVSLDADFSQSDARKVNDNMRGTDALDVGRFPEAKFTFAQVRPLDGQAPGVPGRYEIAGQFTLHGVTRALQFEAKAEHGAKPNTLRLRGAFQVNQTQFGIQPYSALGGLIRVADALTIYGDLQLVPASSK